MEVLRRHGQARAAEVASLAAGDVRQPALRHGSMEVRWCASASEAPDTQRVRDGLYVVARGRAVLVRGGERLELAAGDLAFVPAGLAHRFEEPSADFGAWAISWGPPGGERDFPLD